MQLQFTIPLTAMYTSGFEVTGFKDTPCGFDSWLSCSWSLKFAKKLNMFVYILPWSSYYIGTFICLSWMMKHHVSTQIYQNLSKYQAVYHSMAKISMLPHKIDYFKLTNSYSSVLKNYALLIGGLKDGVSYRSRYFKHQDSPFLFFLR